MTNKSITLSLTWIKDVCNEHEKPNVVAFMCGSVVEWFCSRCGKKQTTNPHYAKHHNGVCGRCEQ